MHSVLPADRGRSPHCLFGNLRRTAALPRGVPLRRRQGDCGCGHTERAGSVRGSARPLARPQRPRGAGRRGARRHPAGLVAGGASITGVRAGEEIPGRAAAASGIPHDADGLVHPAALARGGGAARHGSRRRRCGQPVRCVGQPADPDRILGGAVHRRGCRTRAPVATHAGRHAFVHARPQLGQPRAPRDPRCRRPVRRRHLGAVSAAGDRQVLRPVRDPGGPHRVQRPTRRTRVRTGLRGRYGHVRQRSLR